MHVKYRLMAEAGEGGDLGAVTAPAADATATAAPAAEPSLLDDVAGSKPAAAAPAAPAADAKPDPNDPHAWAPQKYRTLNEKGEFDPIATAQKIAAAHDALTKRMVDGGAPPTDVKGYEFKAPEGMEAVPLDPVAAAKFKEAALGMGLTPKQYQGIMEQYVQMVPELAEATLAYGKEQARTELIAAYGGSEVELQKNLGQAKKALDNFGADLSEADRIRIGNNPVVIRMLARVGAEMGEDVAVLGQQVQAGEDLAALMKAPAYWDAKNPDHARVKAKVQAHFNAQQKLAARGRRAA